MRFRQAAATAHSLDVLLQVGRNLEHAQRGGRQDLLQLRVRRDGAALVELVLLDVRPERLHHLRAGHLVLAADRGEVGGERLGGEETNALLLHRRRILLARSLRRLALVNALRPLAARVLHDLLLLFLLLFLLLLGLLLLFLLLGLLLLRLLGLLRLLRRLLLRRFSYSHLLIFSWFPFLLFSSSPVCIFYSYSMIVSYYSPFSIFTAYPHRLCS